MREVRIKHAELSDISTEILERGGLFRFKAYGSSMYPFIQDGDVLTVQPIVVEKKFTNGQCVFVMRGDSGLSTNEQVPAGHVLGRVMSVRRGQKVIQLDEKFWKLAAHLWITSYPIGAVFLRTETKGKQIAAYFLRRVQALKPYRAVARKFIGNKIFYRVATNEDITGLSKLYCYGRLSNIADPIDLSEKAFSSLEGDGHTLIARFRGKVIGATVITRFPNDEASYPDWWIFGMTVRIPYRGMGIGEGLVSKAIEKVSEEGARRLNLLVFKKNKAAINLYQKMGFRQISIPALDKELEDEATQTKKRRIILSKEI
jgi:ribosomal protein S18 acetylase RimI-like enzyme